MRVLTGTSGFSYKEWKGSFYPEDLSADAMLVVLRRAPADRRDQQHLLPDAEAGPARGLGGAGSGGVPVRAQGFAADHAPQAAEGSGRRGGLLLRRGRDARRAARPGALPAAAQPEEGPSAPRGVPRRRSPRAGGPRSSSATPPGSRRTSSRRCARAAPRSASPRTRTSRRRSSRRPTGATCACAARTTATRTWPPGPSACAPRSGTRPTSSSSTRMPGRDRGSRRSFSRWDEAQLAGPRRDEQCGPGRAARNFVADSLFELGGTPRPGPALEVGCGEGVSPSTRSVSRARAPCRSGLSVSTGASGSFFSFCMRAGRLFSV